FITNLMKYFSPLKGEMSALLTEGFRQAKFSTQLSIKHCLPRDWCLNATDKLKFLSLFLISK
ncbi:MAG: hypothetical protein ACI4XE_05320, partial [Acutalibacteraceae bacterium]